MIINTMLVGHVVTASVTKVVGDTFHCRFMHHTESGAKRLCLDIGQNWTVDAGYEFTCGQVQIDRADYWMEKLCDTFEVTEADVARLLLPA